MKKIYAQIADDQFEKLIRIAEKYNFRSKYELVTWVTQCFLRRVQEDESPGQPDDPLQHELYEMFDGYQNHENKLMFTNPDKHYEMSEQEQFKHGLR